MSELFEENFRQKGVLTKAIYNNEQFMAVKVIYEELFTHFNIEKCITGDYLRKPVIKEANQIYYFPYVEGTTLQDIIRQQIKLSIDDISVIFNQLLIALYELHSQGLLGRCFNISNIYYIDKEIILTIFGFYPNLQMTPPEFLNENTYSISIDIWLLGCILYQLLTNTILPNFLTFEEYNQFYKTLDKKQIDKKFYALILKMLHPNYQKRLSFGELHSIYKCNLQNDQIRLFYRNQVDPNIAEQIKQRENFNQEWATLKEFNEKSPIRIFPSRHSKIVEQPIDDPDPTFLLIFNRSEQEKHDYPQVWREMHFQYFRFFIIEQQIEILKQMGKQSYINWTKLCLQTMLVIIKKEFLKNVQDKNNFLNVPQQEWNQFLSNSRQFRKHINDLQYQLQTDQITLENLLLDVQTQQPAIKPQERQLRIQLVYDGAFGDTTKFDKFDQFKIPYRRCLQFCYYELEKIIDNEKDKAEAKHFARLQLQLIICMTINRIFNTKTTETKQYREINFSNLITILNLQKLNTPYHVWLFIANANLQQLINQTNQIHHLFFARSQTTIISSDQQQ